MHETDLKNLRFYKFLENEIENVHGWESTISIDQATAEDTVKNLKHFFPRSNIFSLERYAGYVITAYFNCREDSDYFYILIS